MNKQPESSTSQPSHQVVGPATAAIDARAVVDPPRSATALSRPLATSGEPVARALAPATFFLRPPRPPLASTPPAIAAVPSTAAGRRPALLPFAMNSAITRSLALLTLLSPLSLPAFAAAPPARLADTGLYADFASRRVAVENLPFSPQYPLWTDGAKKQRWIFLPEGTGIDAIDADAWEFPVGTKLWKEFAWERRVETRYMELTADGWIYATYVWAADESDAVLAPSRGVRAAYTPAGGVGHDIPGTYDCSACHGANPSPVLGFSALQLSSDRDPLAPHAEAPPAGAVDLDQLIDRGLVVNLPASLVSRPPRILAASPRERAALGYLHGNCSSCHNARGPLADLGFSLQVSMVSGRPSPEALCTAVGHGSYYRPTGTAAVLRIAPGDPEASVLYRRVSSRNPAQQMPPFGTHAVDQEAAALLRAWIRHDLAPGQSTDLLAAHAVAPSPSH